MVTISSAAAKKIKSIIDEEDSSLMLRIYVQGGGWPRYSSEACFQLPACRVCA